MSNPLDRLLALAALLALALPAASAAPPGISNPSAPAATTLYFHLGANQDFPINTQEPPTDSYARDEGYGTASNSLTCVPAGTPLDGFTQKRYTTYYGFSSPGYVEYNFTESGAPRVHPERGLSFDVELDPATPNVVHWYMTTFAGPDVGGVPHADPVIPSVVARATVRTGEKITLNDEGYNDGEVIAQGQTEPTTLVAGLKAVKADGQDNPQVTVDKADPAKPAVYGFAIPLAYAHPDKPVIPKASGFSVRVDLFVSLPSCDMASDDRYAMPSFVRSHTDPQHRPRMELGVLNPVRIEYMHPQVVGDDLVVHTSVNSPWGNYDVQEQAGGVTLAIAGPNGPAQGIYRTVVQRTHDHDHHTEAVDVTFVWPYLEQHAGDGTYTVLMEAWNDQGTAKATGVTQFVVGKELTVYRCGAQGANGAARADAGCVPEVPARPGPGGPGAKASPGLALAGLLAPLGAAAALARRRPDRTG